MIEALRKFCDECSPIEQFRKPFNHAGFSYATDGYIILRTALVEGLMEGKLKLNEFWNQEAEIISEEHWESLPNFKPVIICCHTCVKRGEIKDQCKTCCGTGRRQKVFVRDSKIFCKMEGRSIQEFYLRLISSLPKAKISLSFDESKKPIPFKADNGLFGFVMELDR